MQKRFLNFNIKFIIKCICSFIHSYILTFLHSYILTFLHSYIHSFIHSFLHSYILTFILAFLHSYILTSLHPYILTFLHSLILSYIHSFLHSFIHFHKRKKTQNPNSKMCNFNRLFIIIINWMFYGYCWIFMDIVGFSWILLEFQFKWSWLKPSIRCRCFVRLDKMWQ